MSLLDKIYKRESSFDDVKDYDGKIYLNCCLGVEYDLDIVEYTIEYYRDMGVDEMFFVLNTTDKDSPNLKKAVEIMDKYNYISYIIWIITCHCIEAKIFNFLIYL